MPLARAQLSPIKSQFADALRCNAFRCRIFGLPSAGVDAPVALTPANRLIKLVMRAVGCVSARQTVRSVGATVAASAVVLSSPMGIPSAAAEPPAGSAGPCPDVEVIFARGTTEPPGVGGIGQAFVDSLQSQVGPKSVWTYAVNYPATTDFPTAAQGVIDASARVREMAAKCPTTKLVLGGYSQGAAVIGYVNAAEIPPGYSLPPGITGPMPPEVADHVAAVALFGEPSSRFLNRIDAPPIVIGPLYAAKTIEQCISDDPVCTNDGSNLGAHMQYVENGMAEQTAVYAAQRLTVPAAAPGPLAPPVLGAPHGPVAPPVLAAPHGPATRPVPPVPAVPTAASVGSG
jgi:cutinase